MCSGRKAMVNQHSFDKAVSRVTYARDNYVLSRVQHANLHDASYLFLEHYVMNTSCCATQAV